MNLSEVTKRYGNAKLLAKELDKYVEKKKREFFRLADEELVDTEEIETILVQLPDDICEKPWDEIVDWVVLYYPEWIATDLEEKEDGNVYVHLEQDAACLSFSYTNLEDQKVYARLAYSDSPTLDDEALAEAHPDVWERLSEPVEPAGLAYLLEFWKDAKEYLAHDFTAATKFEYKIRERADPKNWPRRLGNLNEADVEDLKIMHEFVIPGQIKVRMEPPRKIKEEDDGKDDD